MKNFTAIHKNPRIAPSQLLLKLPLLSLNEVLQWGNERLKSLTSFKLNKIHFQRKSEASFSSCHSNNNNAVAALTADSFIVFAEAAAFAFKQTGTIVQ